MSRVEYTVEEQALRDIADGLEELNEHFLIYLKVMAVNLLQPCGPQENEAGRKARDAAAVELLEHVRQWRMGGVSEGSHE